METLPAHLGVSVCAFLAPADLYHTAAASRALRLAALDDSVWHAVYVRRFCTSTTSGSTGDGGGGGEACWRAACLRKKRELEYSRALTYGRVGRIASSLPSTPVDRVSIWHEGETAGRAPAPPAHPPATTTPAATATATATAAATAAYMASAAHVSARQGTCTWSVLSRPEA